MAQFDVLRNRRGGDYPLLVDVQADLHARLATRIVVPLAPRSRDAGPAFSRLMPVVRVRGDEYVAECPLMGSVPTTSLGEVVGSLAARRAELIGALDLLVAGS